MHVMSDGTDQHQHVAIVTGASRGIGRAAAAALAAAGWDVVLVSRSEQSLRDAAAMLEQSLVIATDVTDSRNADDIVRRTLDRFGRVDAVVNNAGFAPMLDVEHTTDDIWRQTIDTNLSAAFYLCRAAWPVFKRQGGGVIVNVSSAAARDPFAGFIAYGAAKAGLNVLGLSLAREGAAHHIRVHTIAPGATETEMFRNLPGMTTFPAEKAMSPDDVARVIVQCIRGELVHTSGEVIYLHKGA